MGHLFIIHVENTKEMIEWKKYSESVDLFINWIIPQ